nr:putative reverse transcriptase domain-containing protein [Tanacetum cinerariifolium]
MWIPGTFQEGLPKVEEQQPRYSRWKCRPPVKVCAVGCAGTNPESNVVTCYAIWFNECTSGIYGPHESVMTIGLEHPKQILNAQTEAQKLENIKNEDVGGKGRKVMGEQYLSFVWAGNWVIKEVWEIGNFGPPLFILLLHMSIKAAPFKAPYGRKCRLPVCWVEVGQVQLTGLEIVQETTEKIIQIKQKMQAACDKQKSYVDSKHKPMEFQVGDNVMLKVLAWKGLVYFDK